MKVFLHTTDSDGELVNQIIEMKVLPRIGDHIAVNDHPHLFTVTLVIHCVIDESDCDVEVFTVSSQKTMSDLVGERTDYKPSVSILDVV